MSELFFDPFWPRASGLLTKPEGDWVGLPDRHLTVLGVPLHKRSITAGRCDLAPAAIRKALERYSTYDSRDDRDLGRIQFRDQGDLDVAELSPEEALEPISTAVRTATSVAHQDAVILLGGDNSVTRAGVEGLEGRCGLLTIDAHYDLRHLKNGLNNGNPVRALLEDGLPGSHIAQIGIQPLSNSKAYAELARDAGITVIMADAARAEGIEHCVTRCLSFLAEQADVIYVDLDIDVLDRAYAPGAPGARPGGLQPWELRLAARCCGAHPLVRAIDIVELDPEKDINDVTALTAAACLLEFASGVLARPR